MGDSPIFPDTDAPAAARPGKQSIAVPPGATVIIQQGSTGTWRVWALRVAVMALGASILFNFALFAALFEYAGTASGPQEKLYDGELTAPNKIAIIEVSGTIMPPFTEKLLAQIEKAEEDDKVKGVLLVVDSPGGLVADSHEIYHRLKRLTEDRHKPVYVQMKRLAASGGYYVAMGAGPNGKIYAEETTWTGSIGVIMPRYNVVELADKIGVKSEPLTTGEFKDTLSPFKPLTEREKELWMNILNQSYDKFTSIIDENRDTLTLEQVKTLATGQIFTAKDAKANGLIDEIGYQDDALDALKTHLNLGSVRIVKYESPPSVLDLLLGGQAKAAASPWQTLLESSVPRAYYLCSWLPPLPE